MAKTLKSNRSISETAPMRDSRKYEFTGILLLATALLSIVSLYFAPANNITPSTTGVLGNLLAHSLTSLAGGGRYPLAILLGVWGLAMIIERHWSFLNRKMYGFLVLYLCFLTLLHLQLPVGESYWMISSQGEGGGLIGASLSWALTGIFGVLGSYIVICSVIIVTLLAITNQSLFELYRRLIKAICIFWKKVEGSLEHFLFVTVEEQPEDDLKPVKVKKEGHDVPGSSDVIEAAEQLETKMEQKLKFEKHAIRKASSSGNRNDQKKINQEKEVEASKLHNDRVSENTILGRANENLDFDIEFEEESFFPSSEGFILPSLNLLNPAAGSKGGRSNKDIIDNTRILEETLENFGVNAQVVEVNQGPAITRYEIHPAPGIKVSKIIGLADDIALSMAAQQVRIEAPIPGKSAIGIEVPNKEVALVHLREVLECDGFQKSNSRLSVAFGKDIAGQAIIGDLTKMPHLLIAGATGMGKSVCLNTLIASILFKSTPQEVKFLMIDPKMVELTTFNGIPHLITPVVTNAKKAAIALRWAVNQMEQRYEKFAALGVKDMVRYNKAKIKDNCLDELLPYMVIIIDELADLMMIAPADVEDAICRLAQMARAAGMHLVVATQRPSVDVITGLIKANIPSRIAFAVSSQTDSRTILDVGGAEKLVGRGDMLYLPVGYSKPVRIQGAYISDGEVEKLVDFLKQQAKPQFVEGITVGDTKAAEEPEEEDELFPEAARLFIENGQASISLLQRRFRIGYTRAARLIDLMERKGVIGPFEGSKPREVLMTIEQYETRFGNFQAIDWSLTT